MPWTTIITWIVVFLLSYAATGDALKSALIATGAAAAAYYTIEPTNPDAIFGDAVRDLFGLGGEATTTLPPVDPSTVPDGGGENPTDNSVWTPVFSFGEKVIETAGDVATSWGPAGTLGVVTGLSLQDEIKKNWQLWLIGGVLALAVIS
jgi:hypothetical protein